MNIPTIYYIITIAGIVFSLIIRTILVLIRNRNGWFYNDWIDRVYYMSFITMFFVTALAILIFLAVI